ncbi:peptide ABC transporter permease [Actinomadura sp. NBRC 104412]|uniref:ABC transporter permease n=1 Tax=Actinomadura sp. NBRC 104412 TaxID=3032203 RepID=UPI0024A38FD3|nr:ABC transporter permease [Actinomadura sp. NBRC 104412]GLZ07528.1 peptide ABC transporter permease [Actinomadura sp. NBRC 104412]
MPYVARRLATTLLVLVLASLAIFALLRLAPGDPATILAGQDATPAQVAAIRHELGLDRSLPAQYWQWLSGLLTGDPGSSYTFRQPISGLLVQRAGPTVQLTLTATVVMVVLGLVLGVAAAGSRSRTVRNLVDAVSTAALSTPPFVSSIVMIFVLAVTLRLLPAGGQAGLFSDPAIGIQYVIMPAVAVALPGSAVIARLLATEMRRAHREEFARTAKAKGASRRRVLLRHVLPNSIGPAVVELGIRIGDLFAGAVVVEAIFARSGIGSLLVSAVQGRDYLLAQDILLASVAFAAAMQLLTELSMARVDRRIDLQEAIP